MEQLSHSTGSVSLTRFLTTPSPRMLVIRTTGVLLHESCGSYGCGRRNLTLSVKINQRNDRDCNTVYLNVTIFLVGHDDIYYLYYKF